MRVIAFDLGKNFAFAHNLAGKKPTTGIIVLPGATRAHRLGALYPYLMQQFELLAQVDGSPGFDIVVYETPFARGRDATRSLWGIAGIIEAAGTNALMPVLDVAVPTIKKFAAGSGKASKEEMIAAAKKMGYKGVNEHEADAVCLLRYAEANLERTPT